ERLFAGTGAKRAHGVIALAGSGVFRQGGPHGGNENYRTGAEERVGILGGAAVGSSAAWADADRACAGGVTQRRAVRHWGATGAGRCSWGAVQFYCLAGSARNCAEVRGEQAIAERGDGSNSGIGADARLT